MRLGARFLVVLAISGVLWVLIGLLVGWGVR